MTSEFIVLNEVNDFERTILISAVNKYILEYYQHSSDRKLAKSLKNRLELKAHNFPREELNILESSLGNFGDDLITSDVDLYDDATTDKMFTSTKKLLRMVEDLLPR